MNSPNTPTLSLIDIHKKFGDKAVHQGINLELNRGEVLGLFGGSGTGKSVLIRSIIGLEKPDQGQILFQGEEISQFSEHQWIAIRKKIGFVFQGGALFDSLSVYENLAYPLRAHTRLSEKEISAKITKALEQVDMKGTELLLPNELSGGMQKRAGLARAIILEPEVVLFDEPTAGLDPVNTRRLVDNLKKLKGSGLTGIFVTHDIPTAFALCDRIALLKDGKIAIVDTVENIQKSEDPFVLTFIEGAHIR